MAVADHGGGVTASYQEQAGQVVRQTAASEVAVRGVGRRDHGAVLHDGHAHHVRVQDRVPILVHDQSQTWDRQARSGQDQVRACIRVAAASSASSSVDQVVAQKEAVLPLSEGREGHRVDPSGRTAGGAGRGAATADHPS